MKTNILRSVAVALGLSVCVAGTSPEARAESNGYQASSQWNHFNVQSSTNVTSNIFRTVGHSEAIGSGSTLPVPSPMVESTPIVQGTWAADAIPAKVVPATAVPTPTRHRRIGTAAATADRAVDTLLADTAHTVSVADWAMHSVAGNGGNGGLYPWFGGADLLFMSLENNGNRTLVVDDATATPQLRVNDVDPDTTTGFDIHVGRYLGCGRYGLDLGYFNLNPSAESLTIFPVPPETIVLPCQHGTVTCR